MWCELNGKSDFSEMVLRQQFSKDTDTMSRGRQMVYHLNMTEVGILPVQSPVGMQLGKAAGWAMGYKLQGRDDCGAMAIIGDGTTPHCTPESVAEALARITDAARIVVHEATLVLQSREGIEYRQV